MTPEEPILIFMVRGAFFLTFTNSTGFLPGRGGFSQWSLFNGKVQPSSNLRHVGHFSGIENLDRKEGNPDPM